MNKIDINKKYRTRAGKEPQYLHRAPADWPGAYPRRGIIDGSAIAWTDDGQFFANGTEDDADLIEVPELEFDWSCLPAWAEWITRSAGNYHCWVWWEKEPVFEDGMYNTFKGERGLIHHGFSPRYNGSDPAPIFKRPGKEGGEA